MFILALFCLLAVGSQAKPLQPVVEPAQHIVIVTPQAQVHLEPALRYVHGLSPLARVSGPHHEETIVYVPAGAAASVVPTVPVAETVSTGRASSRHPGQEARQSEGFPQNINQIQQQVQQGVEIASGQFGEAAAAAAAAGAGFFPGFFPSSESSNNKNDELKLKNEKLELIETPANTQPLLAATEARHFYSLPQVYHTPVVDVVHAPVYSWPISAIRARSIQTEEAPIQALQPATELKASPELPEAQPLIKEAAAPEQPEQPLEQLAQTIIPAAIEPSEQKAEIAARQLEETNAIKPEQPAEIIAQPIIKEAIEEAPKAPIQEAQPEAIAEPIPEARKETSQEVVPEVKVKAVPEVKVKEVPEVKVEPVPEARKDISQEPIAEEPKATPNEAIIEPTNEASVKTVKEPIAETPVEEPAKQPIQEELKEEKPITRALPVPVVASVPEADVKVKVKAQPDVQPETEQTVKVTV